MRTSFPGKFLSHRLDLYNSIFKRKIAAKKEAAVPKEDTKQRRKGTKDLKLLSFADDEPEPIVTTKIHSLHDSKMVKDSKLKAEVAPELKGLLEGDAKSALDTLPTDAAHQQVSFEERLRSRVLDKSSRSRRRHVALSGTSTYAADSEEPEEGLREETEAPTRRDAELQRLREGILKSRRAVKLLLGETADKVEKDQAFHNMTSAVEAMRQRYKKRKVELGDRQSETLSRLESFTNSLRNQKSAAIPTAVPVQEAPVYHGQVLEDEDEGAEEELDGWFQGRLKFKKHIDDNLRLGGDGRKLDDIIVIDSRKWPSQL